MIQILHTEDKDWTYEEQMKLLPDFLPLIWKHKDKILADASLALSAIPMCMGQFRNFRIGGLLNCWMNNEHFQLAPLTEKAKNTPVYVFHISGSTMSGICFVMAVDLLTGEIYHRNHIRFRDLFKTQDYKVEPFFTYLNNYELSSDTGKYVSQGAEPAKFSVLLARLNEWENE